MERARKQPQWEVICKVLTIGLLNRPALLSLNFHNKTSYDNEPQNNNDTWLFIQQLRNITRVADQQLAHNHHWFPRSGT